jgi:K+-sensing histidine kinase KdpD
MALLPLPGHRPRRAVVIGTAGVVVALAVFLPLHTHTSRAAPALALVLPVVASALIGGRVAAYVVAAEAALAFGLVNPPIGTLRVELGEDVIALVVFVIVAIAVGTLVASRMELLEQVDRDRAALLRSVSHDLRTPLGAIRAAASELQGDAPHDEAARAELLDLVVDEADRLDRLVANLLSLTRIEAGALAPQRQAVDLGELVAHCAERMERVTRRVPVHLVVEDDLPLVHVDYALVEQVVVNLLENAARHSPDGASVVVGVHRDHDDVRIDVDDEGPGLDPVLQALLFEPFQSGRVAGTSGVGLAIARAVIDAHGGTITVGDAPRAGARFSIRLPRHGA